jgi:hypothetical protein
MAIKYFPNRVFKKNAAAIDRVMAKRTMRVIRGQSNVAASALDAYISANSDWQLNSIKLNFSNAASRNYTVDIASGLKIVTDLNDSLWFQTPTTLWQKITLNAGFYTGTTLATELQSKLNANTVYVAAGLTFTVVYDSTTGLFTITPSTGNVRYIQTNNTQRLPERDSTGGHLLGLTATTNSVSAITSDTAQFGLNTESWIIDESASTVTEHYNNDIIMLSMDQALHLASNTANVTISYEVVYEEIV